MIVSAVSVNKIQTSKFGKSLNSKNDISADLSPIKTKAYPKMSQSNDEEQKMFDAINEWKNFCHQQILNGKLDVIA